MVTFVSGKDVLLLNRVLEVFDMIPVIQKVKQGRPQRHCSFVFTVNTFNVFIYLFDF